MGLVDSRSVATFLFDETSAVNYPSDAAGNLDDLTEGASNAVPAVATGYDFGKARTFDSTLTTGLEVEDTDDDLLLDRGMSILAIVALDTAAQLAAGAGTVCWRGRNTDYCSFGLRITPASASVMRIQLVWETTSGTLVTDAGVYVEWPDGDTMFIAAIREVTGTTMSVRYVVNAEAVAGDTDHAIDVGRPSAADFFVGTEPTGASSYQNYLCGDLFALEIVNEALADEEAQWVWQRMAIDCPNAVEAHLENRPPGSYTDDPAEDQYKEFEIEGAAMGYLRNRARLTSQYGMPSTAFGSRLVKWEKAAGYSPTPTQSIATRRARIVEHFTELFGIAEADILTQLKYDLGVESSDLSVLRGSPTLTEDFTGADADIFGRVIASDGGGVGWVVDTDHVSCNAATDDVVFEDAFFAKAMGFLYPVSDGEDFLFQSKLTEQDFTDTDSFVGLIAGSRRTREWFLFGKLVAGADDIVWLTFKDGVLSSATTLASPVTSTPSWLRMRHKGAGVFDVQWGASEAAAIAQTPSEVESGIFGAQWAGMTVGSVGATSVTIDFDFTDVILHQAQAIETLSYAVYRDPADSGEYNLPAARRRLDRAGPAWGDGHVVDTDHIECDTGVGGVDVDILEY